LTQELISKKDLLVETGISYGQLYRWKRKKLIPEEWFIRKSTFTGQETFFLKDEVLDRIEQIKSMKDDLSLDDMLNVFSGKSDDLPTFATKQELLERNIVSSVVLDQFAKKIELDHPLSFGDICLFYLIDMLLKEGQISRSEGELIYQTIKPHLTEVEKQDGLFCFGRKMGVPIATVVTSSGRVHFDQGVGIISTYSFRKLIEEVKVKWQGGNKDE
jgi:DNA-binding transcriptional MerR regulator